MSKQLILTIFSIFIICGTANADLSEQFNERFEVVANADGEMTIRDKKLFENVSLLNYINHLGEFFDGSKEGIHLSQPRWECQGAEYDYKNKHVRKALEKTFKAIRKFKFLKIVVDSKFAKFLSKFDKLTKELIEREHLHTLANLDNSKYFYSIEIEDYMIKRLIDYIKDNVSIPGGVQLALFLGSKYEGFVHQKRAYDQNILLSYLLTAEPGELGLTVEQTDQAISSIFESRIHLDKFWYKSRRESKKAQKNWDSYGQAKVASLRKSSQKRWKRYKKKFEGEIYRIDPSFNYVQYKGSEIIVDLGNKKGVFTKAPSFTYDDDCPEYNYIKRTSFEILDLGISLLGVPIPGEVKKLYKKQYRKQIPAEGLLYGFLEINNREIKENIVKQAINPFLK